MTGLTAGRSWGEPLAWLALLPAILTSLYYFLPDDWQRSTAIQFLPQATAYVALLLWARYTSAPLARLGLRPLDLHAGLRWGVPIGLVLGVVNLTTILVVVPRLGGDILFLRETPHAHAPPTLMLPWLIVLIAVFVEVNFRGFLLGRLLVLWQQHLRPEYHKAAPVLVVVLTAVLFAFDPFMVATFKHLHWIAVWDGTVWGVVLLRRQALVIPIVAHATEVMLLYSVLRVVLPA